MLGQISRENALFFPSSQFQLKRCLPWDASPCAPITPRAPVCICLQKWRNEWASPTRPSSSPLLWAAPASAGDRSRRRPFQEAVGQIGET